eukprot:CFRG0814T1
MLVSKENKKNEARNNVDFKAVLKQKALVLAQRLEDVRRKKNGLPPIKQPDLPPNPSLASSPPHGIQPSTFVQSLVSGRAKSKHQDTIRNIAVSSTSDPNVVVKPYCKTEHRRWPKVGINSKIVYKARRRRQSEIKSSLHHAHAEKNQLISSTRRRTEYPNYEHTNENPTSARIQDVDRRIQKHALHVFGIEHVQPLVVDKQMRAENTKNRLKASRMEERSQVEFTNRCTKEANADELTYATSPGRPTQTMHTRNRLQKAHIEKRNRTAQTDKNPSIAQNDRRIQPRNNSPEKVCPRDILGIQHQSSDSTGSNNTESKTAGIQSSLSVCTLPQPGYPFTKHVDLVKPINSTKSNCPSNTAVNKKQAGNDKTMCRAKPTKTRSNVKRDRKKSAPGTVSAKTSAPARKSRRLRGVSPEPEETFLANWPPATSFCKDRDSPTYSNIWRNTYQLTNAHMKRTPSPACAQESTQMNLFTCNAKNGTLHSPPVGQDDNNPHSQGRVTSTKPTKSTGTAPSHEESMTTRSQQTIPASSIDPLTAEQPYMENSPTTTTHRPTHPPIDIMSDEVSFSCAPSPTTRPGLEPVHNSQTRTNTTLIPRTYSESPQEHEHSHLGTTDTSESPPPPTHAETYAHSPTCSGAYSSTPARTSICSMSAIRSPTPAITPKLALPHVSPSISSCEFTTNKCAEEELRPREQYYSSDIMEHWAGIVEEGTVGVDLNEDASMIVTWTHSTVSAHSIITDNRLILPCPGVSIVKLLPAPCSQSIVVGGMFDKGRCLLLFNIENGHHDSRGDTFSGGYNTFTGVPVTLDIDFCAVDVSSLVVLSAQSVAYSIVHADKRIVRHVHWDSDFIAKATTLHVPKLCGDIQSLCSVSYENETHKQAQSVPHDHVVSLQPPKKSSTVDDVPEIVLCGVTSDCRVLIWDVGRGILLSNICVPGMRVASLPSKPVPNLKCARAYRTYGLSNSTISNQPTYALLIVDGEVWDGSSDCVKEKSSDTRMNTSKTAAYMSEPTPTPTYRDSDACQAKHEYERTSTQHRTKKFTDEVKTPIAQLVLINPSPSPSAYIAMTYYFPKHPFETATTGECSGLNENSNHPAQVRLALTSNDVQYDENSYSNVSETFSIGLANGYAYLWDILTGELVGVVRPKPVVQPVDLIHKAVSHTHVPSPHISVLGLNNPDVDVHNSTRKLELDPDTSETNMYSLPSHAAESESDEKYTTNMPRTYVCTTPGFWAMVEESGRAEVLIAR